MLLQLQPFRNTLRDLSINDTFSYHLHMDTDKLVGRNLARIRVLRGLSQQELADRIGIKREKISSYENGAGISTGTFERLCKELKVKSWEFHLEDDTPIVRTAKELATVKNMRVSPEAEENTYRVSDIFAEPYRGESGGKGENTAVHKEGRAAEKKRKSA